MTGEVLKTEDVSALNVPAAAVKRESVISQMLTGATPEVRVALKSLETLA